MIAITDGITSTRNVSFWHEPANRLQNANASGLWGTKVFYYDGVGNRIEERTTPPGGSLSTDVYGYGGSNNRLVQITNGATTVRSLSYDNAGNLTSDSGLGGSRTYTYNKRNRLSNALIGAISWDYTYNGQEQLIIRQRTGSTALGDLTHYVHDIYGNVIAETNGGGPTGSTGTVREYIYLPEAEIAPTFGSRTTVDRPVGVVEGVNTASPVLWFVHVDHLNRPVKMTDTAKAAVWDAIFLPWGGVHAITGSATLDARFPGQWFQLESGLHYNWHRQYDPSIGRYTQPDPLGFVDGPSVYGYVRGGPAALTDKDGQNSAAAARCLANPAICIAIPAFITRQCIRFAVRLLRQSPREDSERCAEVRNKCIEVCSDIALPGRRADQGNPFQRCVNQCLHDNDCKGIDYDADGGWSTANPGARKPWRDWSR